MIIFCFLLENQFHWPIKQMTFVGRVCDLHDKQMKPVKPAEPVPFFYFLPWSEADAAADADVLLLLR